MVDRGDAGLLIQEEWPDLGLEVQEMAQQYPLLTIQLFMLIETASLHGGNKKQREMIDNLDKRIEHLERENAALRNRLAWAVKGDQ